MFDQADPYLTSSKNHINGSYELYLGTPGRQGEVHKKSNGTTHTSIAFNDAHYYEKKIRDDLRSQIPEEEYVTISSDVIEAKGKKQFDKRATKKNRDWNRDKARYIRKSS